MKKIILSLFIMGFISLAYSNVQAKEISVFLKQLSNQIMENIYKDLEFAKFTYPGMEGFDKSVLSENQNGIYSINFISKSKKAKDEPLFEFGLTITGIDEDAFDDKGANSFNFGFPLLGIKFVGYQINDTKNKDFDLTKYVQEEGSPFLVEQNKKMPIFLKMETNKDVYNVGEDIEVKISITNVTTKALAVRKLDPKTLYFVYKDTAWGDEKVDQGSIERVKRTVLDPKESLNKTFIVKGIDKPQNIILFSTYRMTYKGVSPAVNKRLKIINP